MPKDGQSVSGLTHKGTHVNQTTWIPNKHCKQKRLGADIFAGYTDNCCQRCTEQLEWRRKYGKYKPLERPTKCHGCEQRVVGRAYHGLCPPCAQRRNVCAKCERAHARDDETQAALDERDADLRREAELREEMEGLPERYRRSAARRLQRGEALADVEEVIEKGRRKLARREASRAGGAADAARLSDVASSGGRGGGISDSDSDEVIGSDDD